MKDIKDGRSISRAVLEEYRFRSLELKDKNWKVNKIAGNVWITPRYSF